MKQSAEAPSLVTFHGHCILNVIWPTFSAFDPIFFFHHANVDHLLSLWSAINPGEWVSPSPTDLKCGSFTIPGNDLINDKTGMSNHNWVIPATSQYSQSYTDLTPFWRSETDFWVFLEITTTVGLNYFYEEFNGLDMDDTQAVSTTIQAFINCHYVKGQSLPCSGSTPGVSLSIKPPNASTLVAHSAPVAQSIMLTSDSEASVIPNNWMVHIHSNKFELGFGYYVLIFLGNVLDEPVCSFICQLIIHIRELLPGQA